MKKIIMTILMVVFSAKIAFAWAVQPVCGTNKKAAEFYEYNACSNEKARLQIIASSGNPGTAFDAAIAQAKMRAAFLRTQPPDKIADPCVYVVKSADYPNMCKL